VALWVQELDCDWQQAAGSVLVAVGKRFTNQVMEEVLSRFQPGMLPHSSVLHTLANLSVSNGECHGDSGPSMSLRSSGGGAWALRMTWGSGLTSEAVGPFHVLRRG
jgi:hypothetical protein